MRSNSGSVNSTAEWDQKSFHFSSELWWISRNVDLASSPTPRRAKVLVSIEVFRGINMVVRNGDPVLAAASCRLLLRQSFQEGIARRGHKGVNAEKLPCLGF